MEAKTKDLWVFVETKEDGSARNAGLELLNPGRMLAEKQGGKLVAVVIGNGVDAAVEAAAGQGADQILVVEGEEYQHYTTDAYVNAMEHLILKYGPTTLLIGATNYGRDMGPCLSSRLKSGLTADCTALDVEEETGNIAWTRPAFGGNLMATIVCRRAGRRSERSGRASLRSRSRSRVTRKLSEKITMYRRIRFGHV